MKSLLEHLDSKNYFSFYLSIFRIFICFHLLKKIYIIWESQSILFSTTSFYVRDSRILDFFVYNFILDNSTPYLYLIIITILLVLFGIGRNIPLIFLFVEIKLLQENTALILNGGDNLMIFVLLYLCFTNCFEHFTLFKNDKSWKFSNFVSNLAVYSICIHLGLVYFLSAIHKIHSDVWFNGTALHYITNVDRFRSPLAEYLDEQWHLLTIGCYFTILFELLFPFFIWKKGWKIIFIISGIFLHLGIYFVMMIYDFQIFFISLYGFFLSNDFWKNLLNKLFVKLNYSFS